MRRPILLCLLALAFSACGPTTADVAATPLAPSAAVTDTATIAPPPLTQTSTPTTGPTQTSTPAPPLMPHRWEQSDPLITMDQYGMGDGGCTFTGELPTTLTLMPNGGLYVLEWSTDGLSSQIKTVTLPPVNTCQLLNSIDQAGFFDYDPATYVRDPEHWYSPIAGMGYTTISVRAWRSNAIELYGAASFIQMQEEANCQLCASLDFPKILPALHKTYDLLASYMHVPMRIYEPDRVGLWLVLGNDSDKWDAVDWPLDAPSVADLATRGLDPAGAPVAILSGSKAAAVEKMFGQKINDCGMVVMNGFDIYRVFARPLLPNEYPSTQLPRVSLSCSPSDGVLPVP